MQYKIVYQIEGEEQVEFVTQICANTEPDIGVNAEKAINRHIRENYKTEGAVVTSSSYSLMTGS